MNDHLWVKITITPIEIKILSNGDQQIIETPTQIEAAEEDAAYGCGICNIALHDGFGTACSGGKDVR